LTEKKSTKDQQLERIKAEESRHNFSYKEKKNNTRTSLILKSFLFLLFVCLVLWYFFMLDDLWVKQKKYSIDNLNNKIKNNIAIINK
jgi:hypothetical protein